MSDYPKYWIMTDGRPVRQLTESAFDQILRPNGQWENFIDPKAMSTEADRVTAAEFDEAVRDWLRTTNAYPKYYVLNDGRPIRQLEERALPEVLRPSGRWDTFNDPKAMGTEAEPLTEGEFEEVVKDWLTPTVCPPQYFDMDGIPVRRLGPTSFPERLRADDGTWQRLDDIKQFWSEASEISQEVFGRLVGDFLANGRR